MRQRLGGRVPLLLRGIPFGPRVLAEELPSNFRAPNIKEYDGSSNPMEHIGKFENSLEVPSANAKKHAANFDNLLAQAEKYVNIEEAAMMKEAETSKATKKEKMSDKPLESLLL
ncbi:hypothetical protein BUALT_Bualt05G0095900 [Buddleja alternifolia]|uniref:Uncharacterized protein n=1 Tax=Buddleja alternifolia TaxID=168488 RepID=A0AAV6XTR6_9LAMI|nr:hypothetical protein BUALT_Bualt05G0095900 [Buddleja alternifolia]